MVNFFEDTLPFICRLPKLKTLVIGGLINGYDDLLHDAVSIDLFKLSEIRKKLFGACKLTIYISQPHYLKTKWATKNVYANQNLIEIKRLESISTKDW